MGLSVLCVFFLPTDSQRHMHMRAQISSDGIWSMLAMCAQDDDFSKRSAVNHSAADELRL
jgi:hypothetical protein